MCEPRVPRITQILRAGDGSVRQPGDRCAEVRLGGVPELHDERMLLECLLDDAALNAPAASMNQPDFAKTGLVGGADVLGDDGSHVARCEGMEIEGGFYRNLHFESRFPRLGSRTGNQFSVVQDCRKGKTWQSGER